ncbi:GNAT family N-acetyltransferase [Saccharospirillum alexandrii]|uniref:GNAT family N-acetyltransferase n=1 Tax=Saccharospirillum alexandrii TaxID=2448477 RepID=UPI000FDB80B3|nr:GNAT family N-acetyltransferase [Saccharospirillum alexandrii]
MSIRAAINVDVPAVSSLVKALAHYYLDGSGETLPSWLEDTLTHEAFLARLSDADYLNLVFEVSGAIVGYISVKKPGHLYHLFVAEEFQGQGISRSLWEHVKRQSQCSRFSVRSSIHAVPVYKRFGFLESGPVGSRDGVSFQPMEYYCEN